MVSVGLDMIEVQRVKNSMQNRRFLKLILGSEEYSQLQERNFPPQSVAANFASKEAFAKAIGLGFRGFSLKEVQIIRNNLGKPDIALSGKALAISLERDLDFSLSITHTKEYACAVVVCFKKVDKSNSEMKFM